MAAVPIGHVATSGVVLAELWYGVRKSQRLRDNEAALMNFLRFVTVLDWPSDAAAVYGSIRADLGAKGYPSAGMISLSRPILLRRTQRWSRIISESSSVSRGLKLDQLVKPPGPR